MGDFQELRVCNFQEVSVGIFRSSRVGNFQDLEG